MRAGMDAWRSGSATAAFFFILLNTLSMNNVTLQKIMQAGWDAYEKSHKLPGYIRNAITSIIMCRTSALGGHVQGCPDGHFRRHWYNSCKHRLCPQCAWIQIERWLIKQQARLLGCDHYHMIFTMPHELNALWLLNVGLMTNLLFTTVRDTLFDFLRDPKYLGVTPGIIASLHTWTQTLLLHPHIHCLVTGGGFSSANGGWLLPKRGDLLPVVAVMHKFRGKLLARIDREILKGNLRLPQGMSYSKWKNLKNRLGRKTKWNVNIRERYSHGKGVLKYLARYIL
ncbi:MAG: transposase [Desulfobulbaceae bacterium]|nr:transposase [Desulfobulbaceae bacterium]